MHAYAPQALVPLLAEEDAEVVAACWDALGAVTGSIPKEMQPSFVRCLKVGLNGRQWRGVPFLLCAACREG